MITRRLVAVATVVLSLVIATGRAQQASASSQQDDTIQLSPFTVSVDKDTGYQAVDTLSGGRTAINLLANPGDVSVLTRDFLDDIGALGMSDISDWLTSTTRK